MIKQYRMSIRNLKQIKTGRNIQVLLCWTCREEVKVGQKIAASQSRGNGGIQIRHLTCAERIRVI